MNETNLKPCKCGAKAEIVTSQAFSWCNVYYFVRCESENCDCRTAKHEHKVDAINEWNRRAADGKAD